MKQKNNDTLFIDLSNLEKFGLNTYFLMVLGYIFIAGAYSDFLTQHNLRFLATAVPFVLILIFFLARIIIQYKKTLLFRDRQTWHFYKAGKTFDFEICDISAIKKSAWGLYSSIIIVAKGKKLCIPAEMTSLRDLISDLSQNLPKEQIDDLLKFCKSRKAMFNKIEKSSRFLRFFCYFIIPLSIFITIYAWGVRSDIIRAFWAFISLIYPLFWTVLHWILLRISVANAIISARISALWIIFGMLLYMTMGVAYRQFYFWLIFQANSF